MAKKKLMIVDDEKLICWTLQKTFTKYGYDVICFNSGEQALEGMRVDPAQAVILDFRLPGINGLEVLEKIRKVYPDTRVLMISAWGTAEVRRRAEDLGVVGFYDKPLSLPLIKEAVTRAFSTPGEAYVGD